MSQGAFKGFKFRTLRFSVWVGGSGGWGFWDSESEPMLLPKTTFKLGIAQCEELQAMHSMFPLKAREQPSTWTLWDCFGPIPPGSSWSAAVREEALKPAAGPQKVAASAKTLCFELLGGGV